ncbi:prevent-host-death protein [Gordonia sp. (in: high G+C Gram-positive bacteria)]|uniref:prevent-host-death protein n=1 Tax=Gordonia sp. (in: high G+C Gram-positive bacteria) TaxID=84139 RepID=UPI003C746897
MSRRRTCARCPRRRELCAGPHEVFAEAEDHPVTVTRRDGEDLVLMSRRHVESRNRLLEFAAQLIGVAVADNGPLADRMANAFPWMLALSVKDRETCAQDLVDAARASFFTDQPHRVLAELTSWRETATALAAGLGQADVEWLDDDVAATVERP